MAQNAQSYQGDKVPEFRIATKAMEMLDYTLRITETRTYILTGQGATLCGIYAIPRRIYCGI